MRLIDADALTEKCGDWYVEEGTEEGFIGTVKQLIDAQPEQRWIPVSERLPDEKGEYLVTYHPCYWDDVEDEIKVGIDSFRGKTAWAKKKYQRVIAWMPLPEPYKGEER